jgi:hypothetical protein
MERRKHCALSVACLSLLCQFALGQPLPETATYPHEGVASCATSVCHGKISPDPDANVRLNEYRVWLRQDYHSRAYRTLLSAQSKTIADKLGLPSAQGAKICLDCHADNVAAVARGRRFQISDGVGCEACHGGAGKWLESHAELETSHGDNIAAGMYPTEQPLSRARLCLSCHLGTRNKFATHAIMGAGHPRLAFELETFTVNQPAHYEVDADYSQRKPAISSVNMWLTGLAVVSLQTLELLQSPLFDQDTLIPELSFYQCHACHHPMDTLRWQPEGGAAALAPGSLRLNDGNLRVLVTVLKVLAPARAQALEAGIAALHRASLESREAVIAQAIALQTELQPVAEELSRGTYDPSMQKTLRRALLVAASEGSYRHFTAAEQAFMAIETLSIALAEQDKYSTQLDVLFKAVGDENQFVPGRFAVTAQQMLVAL